jgi:hypothetical protein
MPSLSSNKLKADALARNYVGESMWAKRGR